MRYLVFVILFFFIGCQDVEKSIKKTTMLIHDTSPKWVKQIKNNEEIQKNGYRCYESVEDAFSDSQASKLVQKDIYSQISREILSMVSSDFSNKTSYDNDVIQKHVKQDVKIKSFADITGIHVHNYYDDVNNKAYGYVCISEYKFQQLQVENNRKHKLYMTLVSKLEKAINSGDRESAINILNQIKLKVPTATKFTSFKELEKKVNNLIKIHIELKSKYRLGDRVIAKIFSNKFVYINVIIKNKMVKLLVSNYTIQTNKTNNILLIKKLTSEYEGSNEVLFFITKTPLNLIQFSNHKILDNSWYDYINEFKNEQHFIKEIKKDFVVDKQSNNFCIINRSMEYNIFNKFKNILRQKVHLVSCNTPNVTKIEYFYNHYLSGNNDNINIKLKFYKHNNLISSKTYSGMFYKYQNDKDIYILPKLYQMVKQVR